MDDVGAMPRPMWLCCDPGHDDALAIILAGYGEGLELLGVSTVAGNQTVDKVTLNALGILHAAGLDHIGVVQGQGKPLVRLPILCPEIHGESGLCLPDGRSMADFAARPPLPGKAVNVMFERISTSFQRRGAKVGLVCTGALTNAALLLTLYPEVVPMVDIVLMGGCLGAGNTGPVAEFNIQTDPEAAKVVFEAGAALTMVPLEVTHTALVMPAILQRITRAPAAPSPFLSLIASVLTYFATTYKTVFGFDAPPLHDPVAVAYLICPQAFVVEHMRVDIEVCSSLSAGQTVCDFWGQSLRPKNCYVAKALNLKVFWDIMVLAIHAADARSPLNSGGLDHL